MIYAMVWILVPIYKERKQIVDSQIEDCQVKSKMKLEDINEDVNEITDQHIVQELTEGN